ncbi:MAG: ATP-binding protein, partial [Bacteroidota bacterium]
MNQHAIQQSLIQHLDWLQELLNLRMQEYFQTGASEDSFAFPPPPPPDLTVPLDRQFEEFQLCREEKVIVLLALAPHLKPQLLDVFYTNNPSLNRHFTEFGGIKGKIHSGFLPTKETAVFLLAGGDLHKRIEVTRLLQSDQKLYNKQILERDTHQTGDPPLSSPLNLAKTFLPTILWDRPYSPDFGSGFPAHRVKTQQDWDDLILAPYVMEQVMEIKAWMEHADRIQKEWGLQKFIKPGYRSLFFGPPGTGKTLTASLLGKSLNREVYRIDLAMVISKYIGETEKNLANLFDLAAHRNWILFFDEADALFG